MVKIADIVNALTGTYSLLNNTVFYVDNGTQIPSTWGNSPSGLLTYTKYGYMSAVMAATVSSWRPTDIRWPPKETDRAYAWELVGRHSLSYAGPFALNSSVANTKTQGQFLHGPIMTASVPAMVNETQARNYHVTEQGGEVYLNVWLTSQGLRSEIWWKRVVKG
ncbi:Lipocalin-like domain-containing protein [Lasiosphaeria hispida]|uniref:Lipocalin-like domain-containing protein n=1 Tax=Lasiosphaeria hispida TaxID=260671 RepID=A0AAJ0MIW3_9PEZI|nr:Lipocalin-like domain-containing protein [Lasiosphaeria hispida]